MIFYFSGTGNSLQIARNISECNRIQLVSIAECMNTRNLSFDLKQDEIVGFVYPVYAWAPPLIVLDFIDKLKLKNYNNNYTFSVATCGDNIGETMKVLSRHLKAKGIKLDSGFSVQMPNNYIISFEVDTKEVERNKLLAAETSLKSINEVIQKREKGVFRLVKGFIPSVLTGIVNPLFNNFAINPGKFHTGVRCTGCGICADVCPVKNITIDKKPSWGSNCTQCLACINYCPTRALQYGKGTSKRGRYTNPYV